jgi:SAM-dependent methyltransferase
MDWLKRLTTRLTGNASLPKKLPEPFVCTRDIGELRQYFKNNGSSTDPVLQDEGTLSGFCSMCNQEVLFEVLSPDGDGAVNWRETVKCPGCGLINRWRGSLHLFQAVCEPSTEDRIYITEALSPVAELLSDRFPDLKSSEFMAHAEPGERIEFGSVEVCHEDVTGLSFGDNSFDALLTFDVLEHVPEYHAALLEFHRVLDFGGYLILTVPFSFENETVTRAIVNDSGEIEHLVEPCYHGDPLSSEGVLAYYDFGAELLEQLKGAGFRDSCLVCYTSKHWGYPSHNVAYIARK